MSKFCGNCGSQMDDSAKVCGNCGTPFESVGQTAVLNNFKLPKESKMTPERKSKIKKGITLTVVLALLVVVTIVALNIVSNFVGYKGALRKAVNAVNDYDVEAILDVSSQIKYASAFVDPYEIEEAILNEVSAKLDYYESIVGYDPKITYTITDSYKLSERKLQDFITKLESNYSYDCYSIEDVVMVDLSVEVTGTNKNEEYNYVTMYLVKENGKWYVFNGFV